MKVLWAFNMFSFCWMVLKKMLVKFTTRLGMFLEPYSPWIVGEACLFSPWAHFKLHPEPKNYIPKFVQCLLTTWFFKLNLNISKIWLNCILNCRYFLRGVKMHIRHSFIFLVIVIFTSWKKKKSDRRTKETFFKVEKKRKLIILCF